MVKGSRTPLSLAMILWIAAALISVIPAVSLANHVHMQGGPFVGVVLSVVVDPKNPNNVYCAAFGGGVFRSRDGGGSWKAISQGFPNQRVLSLLLHPRNPRRLFAGTDQGIFYSPDGGDSWRPLTPVLKERNIRAMVFDPEGSGALYAATDRGVFRGHEGKWQNLSQGLAANDVRALALSPGRTVYAGTFDGVFKKELNEPSWVPINDGLTDKKIRALASDPISPATLYAGTASRGVFKTTDGGRQWAAANRGILNKTVLSFAMASTRPPTLYAGTVGGVFKSLNGGARWSPTGSELPFTVTSLAFDPVEPSRVYAGSGGRVFKSTNAGRKWEEMAHRVNHFGSGRNSATR